MPTADIHRQLASELMELEATLRELRLWHDEAPSVEALASVEPFACDTLLFTEWLQFIFIPRFRELTATGAPLPARCDIAPMAEEYFRAHGQHCAAVLAILVRMDRLVTSG